MAAPQTVAQMIAVISGDTTDAKKKLTEYRSELNETRELVDKLSAIVDSSFTQQADSVNKVSQAFKESEQAAKNLADFEFKTGQRTVTEYKDFLYQRLDDYETYTSEWRSASMSLAAADIAEQKKVTATLAAELRTREALTRSGIIANGGSNYKQNLRTYEQERLSDVVIKGLGSAEEQAAASEKLVQLQIQQKAEEVRLEEESVAQRSRAIANLTRFEYEQGNLSEQAYRVSLQRRMEAYGEYTSEWKAASSELLALDRAETKESEAIVTATYKQREAVVKEYNESVIASTKAMYIGLQEDMDAFYANKAEKDAADLERKEASANRFNSIKSGLGNIAAGITGVSVASAIMESTVDSNMQSIANNTTMTSAEIDQMKSTVMSLAKETGASFDDLAKGYMYIADQNFKGADAANILRLANEEGISTNTKAEVVARSLATTIHMFGGEAKDAGHYLNVLHIAAASGGTTMGEFVEHAGPALAIAREFGISFTDAVSSIAALTKAGFNAAEATTQIKGITAHIGDPSNGVTKTLMELEKLTHVPLVEDFTAKGLAAKGLMGIFEDLAKIVNKDNIDVLGKILPAMRGGIGAGALIGNAKQDYMSIYASANQGFQSNYDDSGFQKIMEETTQQVKKLTSEIETDFMPVGKKAAQLFLEWEPSIHRFSDFVLGLMTGFQRLPDPIQKTVEAIGGLVLLNKFTGILQFLKIPSVFTSSLSAIYKLIPSIAVEGTGLATSFNLVAGSTAGLATALGPSVLLLALGAALVTVGLLIDKFYELTDEQNKATQSTLDFANAQNDLSKKGKPGAYLAEYTLASDKLAREKSVLDTMKENRKGPFNAGYSDDQISAQETVVKNLQEQASYARQKAYSSGRLTPKNDGPVNQYGEPIVNSSQTAGGGTNSGDGVHPSLDDLAALRAKEAQEKANRKAAEEAAKALEKRYESELQGLAKVIALGKEKEAIDEHNKRNAVEADLADGGKLAGLSKEKAEILLAKADLADASLHAKYISDAIDKANDKLFVSMQSPQKQKAIELVGGIDQWRALGDGASQAQQHVLNAVQEIANAENNQKAQVALDNLILKMQTLGQAAKQAAIESVAGGDAARWKSLSPAEQTKAISDENMKGAGNGLLALYNQYSDKAKESSSAVKTESEAAQRAIDDLIKKYGAAVNDPRWKVFIDGIKSSASTADENNVTNWLDKQSEEIDAKQKEFLDGIKQPGENSSLAQVGQEAVDKWIANAKATGMYDKASKVYGSDLNDNLSPILGDVRNNAIENRVLGDISSSSKTISDGKKAIQELSEQLVGVYSAGDRASLKWSLDNKQQIRDLEEYFGAYGVYMVETYEKAIAKQAEQEAAIKTYQSAASNIEDSMRSLAEGTTTDPFQKWLVSYETLQAVIDKNGNTIGYKLGLPTEVDVNLMHQIYQQTMLIENQLKSAAMIHEAIGGIGTAAIAGLNAAFDPSSSQRSTLQQQLLQEQQQMAQYQIQSAEFMSKYPGDPNNPYAQNSTLVTNLQKQIDQTQKQFDKLGNNIGNAFKRAWGTAEQSFQQTLVKLGEDYLQSALVKYLTQQFGLPSSVSGTGGSSGGSILGLISTGISAVATSLLGGQNNTGFGGAEGSATGENPAASYGATPGDDDITTRAQGARTTVINYNQKVYTPDTQGVRRSQRSMSQDLRRAFA